MIKSESFTFKEKDEVGLDTLDVIAEAEKFNRWMFETIAPHCFGKVLEIGSGIGNISAFFIERKFDITLTDIRVEYCKKLEEKFGGNKNVEGVNLMDLVDPNFDSLFGKFFDKFDTIFALNVVEHIKDDQLAIANCRKMLKKGGKLIILVPAYQWLYNGMDEDLEHYRRYNVKSLTAVFEASNLSVKQSKYFNFIGIFGWLFTGKLLRKRNIPGDQMKIFNYLVPVFKVADKILGNSMGLSVIVVGEKE